MRIGQANALLQGRDYVIPEDVKAFAHEVLRHRILMTFEALADGVTSDQVVDSIVQAVPVPGSTRSVPTIRSAEKSRRLEPR